MKKITLLSLVALVACGDDDRREGDMGVDMGTSAEDMFVAIDIGTGDPCTPLGDDLSETVGCNGPPLGPGAPMNEFGGECTGGPSDMRAGSCTESMALCSGAPGEMGHCLVRCTWDADHYITTGGCPSGSRCFSASASVEVGFAICVPDCRTSADCLEGHECDEEGACWPPL